MILVNPPNGQPEIPNLALGYIAPMLGARVVDLNTAPDPMWPTRSTLNGKYGLHDVRFSVQPRSHLWARMLADRVALQGRGVRVGTVTCDYDVQCSYPYLRWADNLHVSMYAIPDYSVCTSSAVFLRHWQDGSWPYPLLTSFGCPYVCTYCAARNRGWQARSEGNLWAEVHVAVDVLRVRRIAILDDCFNHSMGHVMDVCEALRGKVPWVCANGLRADCITEPTARAMSKSGCTTVGIGVETLDPGLLKSIRKGEGLREIERGVAIAQAWFASVSIYLIAGLPGSSYEIDMRSLDWAAQRGVYVHASSYLSPGSEGAFDVQGYGTTAYDPLQLQRVLVAARDLASPAADPFGAVAARWRAGRRWGWRCAARYLRADVRKAWGRVAR